VTSTHTDSAYGQTATTRVTATLPFRRHHSGSHAGTVGREQAIRVQSPSTIKAGFGSYAFTSRFSDARRGYMTSPS
jgi:hypothetical protein